MLRAAEPGNVPPGADEPADAAEDRSAVVARLLRSVRRHLGVDVSYVAEFAGEDRSVRYAEVAGLGPLHAGQVHRLEDSLCQQIVEGRLPHAVRDVAADPALRDRPAAAGGVRAHVGVPVRLRDGSLFGAVCALSTSAPRDVDERDLVALRVAADVVAGLAEEERSEELHRTRLLRAIRTVLSGDGHRIVYQPIVELDSRRPVGYEALSRFAGPLGPGAEAWFAAATEVGLGVELELGAVAQALQGLDDLPPDAYLSVNVGPATVASGRLPALLAGVPRHRVVLELTEHARVDDYPRLAGRVAELARDGVRIAIDDAGAGYASLRHVLWLSPDIVKLDVSVCLGVHRDPARQAMAWALGWFSRRMRVTLVAEGIEDPRDLAELQSVGVRYGQGFLLGRPAPLRQPVGTALPA